MRTLAIPTPRELADACCNHCRALRGPGPWCPRCGRNRPGAPYHGRFTDDVCDACYYEMWLDA